MLGVEKLGVGMERLVVGCGEAKAFRGLGVENPCMALIIMMASITLSG